MKPTFESVYFTASKLIKPHMLLQERQDILRSEFKKHGYTMADLEEYFADYDND
jgi:hypothetical protein